MTMYSFKQSFGPKQIPDMHKALKESESSCMPSFFAHLECHLPSFRTGQWQKWKGIYNQKRLHDAMSQIGWLGSKWSISG